MKTTLLAATALASCSLAGCATMPADRMASTEAAPAPAAAGVPAGVPRATGYFAEDSALPFHAPDFTRIAEADYIPAFEQGMAIERAEIAAITANSAAPTFENTIVARERAGRVLGRVQRVFDALTGANTTDGLDAINEQIAPPKDLGEKGDGCSWRNRKG